jgi:hypothetical protein
MVLTPGSNGANGADAKAVKLNPSKHVINYSVAGAETDTIIFNAVGQNVAGTATYRYYVDNVAQGAASSTSTFTLPDALHHQLQLLHYLTQVSPQAGTVLL